MEPLVIEASQRADTYKLLAECYCLPDEKLIGRLDDLARQADDPLGELSRVASGIGDIEALRVDYARLFVGPFKLLAPPYGSLYLEGDILMGNSTADVVNWYRQEGVEIAVKDMPDHVVAELEFMHILILKDISATGDGDAETACDYREKQRSFLGAHLGAWVTAFTEKIRENARTEYYKALGRVTGRFIHEDLARLHGSEGAKE